MSAPLDPDRLRVCFFIPSFGYGGAQKQCILLLNELRHREDLELTLIRFGQGPQDHLLEADGIQIEFVHVSSNFDPRAILRTLRVVRRHRADILISWIRVCDIYAFFISKLAHDTAWILTQRNSHTAPTFLYRLRYRLGRHADAIVANSVDGVNLWCARRPRGEVFLVDNVRAPEGNSVAQPQTGLVLYAGRLVPQKNVDVTVRAFIKIARERSDVRFVLCGDGELRGQLESLVAAESLISRITFLGFRSDLADWVARAHVLASLSHHEGMPNIVMEGISAGTTLVVSDIAEHRELLGDDYPYLVARRNDVDECAAAILAALELDENTDILEGGRRRLERMDPRRVANAYAAVFAKVATQHAPAAIR